MNNIKPYKLEWKILKILYQFSSADLSGLYGAVKEHYSIHTLRKALKKMELKELVYSVKDSKRNKVYALTEKGIKEIESINHSFRGLEEAVYNNIILKWSNTVGGKITTTNLPTGVNAISIDDEGRFTALVIENESEGLKELLEGLKGVLKGSIPFLRVYILLFNSYRRQSIVENLGGDNIAIFEID